LGRAEDETEDVFIMYSVSPISFDESLIRSILRHEAVVIHRETMARGTGAIAVDAIEAYGYRI